MEHDHKQQNGGPCCQTSYKSTSCDKIQLPHYQHLLKTCRHVYWKSIQCLNSNQFKKLSEKKSPDTFQYFSFLLMFAFINVTSKKVLELSKYKGTNIPISYELEKKAIIKKRIYKCYSEDILVWSQRKESRWDQT